MHMHSPSPGYPIQLAGPGGETITKNTPFGVNSHKSTTNCTVCEKIHYLSLKVSQWGWKVFVKCQIGGDLYETYVKL